MERTLDSQTEPCHLPWGSWASPWTSLGLHLGGKIVSNRLPRLLTFLATCDSSHYKSLWAHACN